MWCCEKIVCGFFKLFFLANITERENVKVKVQRVGRVMLCLGIEEQVGKWGMLWPVLAE